MKGRIALIIAIAIGLIVGALLFAKVDPWTALITLFRGAFGSPISVNGTLKETMPLLIGGIAVFIALKAGLYNIGAEGQLLIGAITASYVGLVVTGPIGIILAILAAMVAGLIWALPAGLIKAYRNGHEVVTTIMFNCIAMQFTLWLANGPLKDKNQQNAITPNMNESTYIPSIRFIGGIQLSWSLIVGVLLLIAVAVWLKRTVAGYELRATGDNPKAAALAGINTKATLVKAMCISGAIAGLAGAMQVLAYEHRFYSGFSVGYGFNALGVALLAANTAWIVIPSALLLGAIDRGSVAMQSVLQVPKGISHVVVGLIIVTYAVIRYRKEESHD